jgi:hypothetical protein
VEPPSFLSFLKKSLFLPRLANAIQVIFPSPYTDYNIVDGMAPSGNR